MHVFDYIAQKRGFNKSAAAYPKQAQAFKQINALLLDRLKILNLQPERILDLGAGTGQLSRDLLKLYPKARIYCLDLAEERLKVAKGKRKWFKQQHYIAGDMHALPFHDQSFDLVVSNLTWYWADHLNQAIYEAKRVLKNQGSLLFTSFGPDTLRELRSSFAAASENPHINCFLDMHDVGDSLLKAGFADPVMDVEYLTHHSQSVTLLLKHLQSLGESNYHTLRARTLLSKKTFKILNEHYEQFRTAAGYLPVTLEVVFGYAWRKPVSSVQVDQGEIAIPVNQITTAKTKA